MNIRLLPVGACCAVTLALTLALTTLMSAACSRAPAPAVAETPAVAMPPATQDASALFAAYWEDYLRLNPVEATFVGDARYNAELPNLLGAEYRAQQHAFREKWLARVRALDAAALSPTASARRRWRNPCSLRWRASASRIT